MILVTYFMASGAEILFPSDFAHVERRSFEAYFLELH